MPRRAHVLVVLLVSFGVAACTDAAPRMHVTRNEVPAGEPVVVHLEDALAAPRSGALWLTLAPADAPDSFVGERVMIDGTATHVAVPTHETGHWEVRLHDAYPRRPHHLIARAKIDVVFESASATFMSK